MNELAIRWRRRCYLIVLAWMIVTIATSFDAVRGVLILPLYQSDADARGEIAYVMADGPAYWERLHAASDLYHWERIERIYVLEELDRSSYDFVRKQSTTRLQRAIDYLAMCGVPSDVVVSVPARSDDWLSSRSEAVGVAGMQESFDGIVVVTSPPHTRRSKLCFQRVFAESTPVSVYSANSPAHSAETHCPIWIEYAKLLVYWICA